MYDYPYLVDIKRQPESLTELVSTINFDSLAPIIEMIHQGKIDRIIMTGMGASYYALYPAWLELVGMGFSATIIDASELVNSAYNLIQPKSMVWIVSQSGLSAEVISLLTLIKKEPPAAILAIVNELSSPLALSGDNLPIPVIVMPIGIGTEQAVSTRTYINTLAITQLVVKILGNKQIETDLKDLLFTAQGMTSYLDKINDHLLSMKELIGEPSTIVLLGRGKSLPAVNTGSLILAEAAKFPALGYHAGEFRHGPLEIAGPNLTVFIFAGVNETAELNFRLGKELFHLGAKVFWVGSPTQMVDDLCLLPMPEWRGIGLSLAEIIPIQLLSIQLAVSRGKEPGNFIHIGKVTLAE